MKRLTFIPVLAILGLLFTMAFFTFQSTAASAASTDPDYYWFEYTSGDQGNPENYGNPSQTFSACPGEIRLCKVYLPIDPQTEKPDPQALADLIAEYGDENGELTEAVPNLIELKE